MEQDASAFAAAVEDASDKLPTHAIQQLKGRFRFLWGMYKAHSEVREQARNATFFCDCNLELACLCSGKSACCRFLLHL